MGLVSFPSITWDNYKITGPYILCALLSLVLPGLVMYLVPQALYGLLAMGLLVTMVAYSAKIGLGSVVIIYMALVRVTWEALRLAVKKCVR